MSPLGFDGSDEDDVIDDGDVPDPDGFALLDDDGTQRLRLDRSRRTLARLRRFPGPDARRAARRLEAAIADLGAVLRASERARPRLVWRMTAAAWRN